MIEVKNLTKVYKDRAVLDIESLVVEKGECIVLTGHNGSGKSTFLKILAGTLKESSGEIKKEGKVCYLPQQCIPFNKSVRRNITFCLDGSRKSKNALCDVILKAFGLNHLEHKNAKTLSGGECQRLCLARVLSKKADIVLLDEPTSAADKESRAIINRLISDYRKQTGCTVIMTSHTDEIPDFDKVKIIKLCDGKITEIREESNA